MVTDELFEKRIELDRDILVSLYDVGSVLGEVEHEAVYLVLGEGELGLVEDPLGIGRHKLIVVSEIREELLLELLILPKIVIESNQLLDVLAHAIQLLLLKQCEDLALVVEVHLAICKGALSK